MRSSMKICNEPSYLVTNNNDNEDGTFQRPKTGYSNIVGFNGGPVYVALNRVQEKQVK